MAMTMRHSEKGFTLIETLVALLVVVVAYTGVTTAVARFVDQRLILVERHTSHRIAWNRLMEQYLVSLDMPVEEGGFAGDKGEVNARGNSWNWRISEDDAAAEGFVRYQVDVYSAHLHSEQEEADGSPSGSLTAFFIRPR